MNNAPKTLETPPSAVDAPETALPPSLAGFWSTHTWSGWPGAYCTACGVEDPLELALADGVDCFTGQPLPEAYRAPLCPAYKPEEFQP